ncbi:MAG: hypothetical protein LBE23_03810 [Vagococcus sp.]|jgi:hypothetical protein|nr:hypothetical protein [Vagococcus sp.]
MMIEEEKRANFMKVKHGEEFHISKIAEILKDCVIYKKSISIGKDTIGLFDIEKFYPPYKTIILSSKGEPLITKESTSEIVSRFRKTRKKNVNYCKMIIKETFGKGNYLHAYIEKDMLLIPLEGESKGNVSYINLVHVDAVTCYSEYESVISFSDYSDVIVPKCLSSCLRRLEVNLQHYIACECSKIYSSLHNQIINPFNNWQGKCHEDYHGLIVEVIKKLDVDTINDCRTRCELKYEITDNKRDIIMEDNYTGKL